MTAGRPVIGREPRLLHLPGIGGSFPARASSLLGVDPNVIHKDGINNGSSSSDTLSFPVPSALANDDVAVLITFKAEDLNPTFPGESFTLVDSQAGTAGAPDRGLSISYKLITDAAAEKAGSPWTFVTASAAQHLGFLYVIRGADTADIIETSNLGNTSTALNPLTTGVLTTGLKTSLGIFVSGGARTSAGNYQVSAPPAGLSNFQNVAEATANNICFAGAATAVIDPSTTTSFGTWSPTFGSSSFVTMVAAVAINLA